MDLYLPHTYGSFATERRCNCGDSELFSIEMRRIECDFMPRYLKRGINVDRVAAGICSAAIRFFPAADCPRGVRDIASSAFDAMRPTWDQDLTHEALEVLYKCRLCRHEVHVTYEILGNGNASNDFGRYTDTYARPRVLDSGKNTSFVDIERVYRSMWTNHDFFNRNCKHWTDEITNRIWNLPSRNIF
uniref:PPPDE domain-containing protein n=1 Tax=Globodera pallida TaxID=36090 RepID=A0A183CLS1_GLOPA